MPSWSEVYDNTSNRGRQVLQVNDKELLHQLFSLLTIRTTGFASAYGSGSTFGKSIADLPAGLRAMAATHWLDISLTLDSITWHFGNFGEPYLVDETEAGLAELGLERLASCFSEAKRLMLPLLQDRIDADGDAYEILERSGLRSCSDELDRRANDLYDIESGDTSVIYEAWLRYARRFPEHVFGN